MPTSPFPPTVTIDGTTLALVVERKRVKNVNARLRDGTLYISAPQHMPMRELDAIIEELGRRLVRRVHARMVNAELDAVSLARGVAARFPSPPDIRQVTFVTTQRARWGSYSPATGTIRLHAALRSMPRWVLEAVVAHELAHVVHPNHSPAFWELTRRVCPETDRARAFLAGVGWLAGRWRDIPPVELALLAGADACDDASETAPNDAG